jgi:hypothetical protein
VANSNTSNVSVLINQTAPTNIYDESAGLGMEYRFSQNYPNPFNARTTIKYSLSRQAAVSIEIFDISGSKIASIAKSIKPAGNHQVIWDASGQASGIYFCKIKIGSCSEVKKMVMMK